MFHSSRRAPLLAILIVAIVPAWPPTCCAKSNSVQLTPKLRTSEARVSNPLDPSFAGFGIEASNLFSYTGGETTNKFSVQLLQNLADFAGKPPHIRLGGNTQDYMIYDEGHIDFAWKYSDEKPPPEQIEGDSMVFGPSFFTALERFPKDTPITYGLNLGYSGPGYLDRIVETAAAAVHRMRNVKLYSFEIGNEPDLYWKPGNGMRDPVNWNGYKYTDEFLERAEVVYQQVLQPAGLPSEFFEVAATASTIGNTFEVKELQNAGILDPYNGRKYVSSWNQHDYFYFFGVTASPLTIDYVLDLDATNRQFEYWRKQVGIALGTGLPYALREMSCVGPLGHHGVSDTFAAAIWTLNFFLFAATLDISSVQMHMTDNSLSAAWQPIFRDGKAPFVRPPYYAHVAMAQIIGNGNGTTQVGELPVNDLDANYKGRVRAYAAYARNHLQAVILINSRLAEKSVEEKPGFIFKLDLGEENGNKDIYISYLTAPGADSLTGTTFNGMTFSSSDGKMTLDDATAYVLRTSSMGIVSISVRDSEALVANIGSQLGRNKVSVQTDGFVPKKQSTASSSTSGPKTAVWTGAMTMTLALAGSATGESNEKKGASRGSGVGWKLMCVCVAAVVLGFAYIL